MTAEHCRTMSPADVAAVVGFSEWWVREQCRRGAPHLRGGRGVIRLLPHHVDALLRRAEVQEVRPETARVASATLAVTLGATARSAAAHRGRACSAVAAAGVRGAAATFGEVSS